MISSINFKNGSYDHYLLSFPETQLSRLNRINLFIGQNNAGKSRFLRKLFTEREYEFELRHFSLKQIKSKVGQYLFEFGQAVRKYNIEDANNIGKKLKELLNHSDYFLEGHVKDSVAQFWALAYEMTNIKEITGVTHLPGYGLSAMPKLLIFPIQEIGKKFLAMLSEELPQNLDYVIDKIYIPILRGLRPLPSSQFIDSYKKRTITDYFADLDSKAIENQIFTGLSLYEDTKKLLLGPKHGRENIKQFEQFLSESFFEGQQITLIPEYSNDVLLIGIGADERPVFGLGDGIQSLIILLYPLFFNQEKNLTVFIEEPETSLHPGLQRLFLETLLDNRFKNFQYFITTHSNHFLDITLDISSISVFKFGKEHDDKLKHIYRIENVSNDDIRVLDLLGARNASVFLSNCTIWVEGVTDRLYLKKYLEIYQTSLSGSKNYQEDFHYSFVEYGGGNIVHWSFGDESASEKIRAHRISNKILLIADRDSTDIKQNSKKAKRLQLLSSQLKENFIVINGREIENTIHENVLISAIKHLQDPNVKLAFDENAVKHSKYAYKKLGTFINKYFSNQSRNYESPSGTISCKLDLCKASLQFMTSPAEMTAEGLRLGKFIYDFIRTNNAKI